MVSILISTFKLSNSDPVYADFTYEHIQTSSGDLVKCLGNIFNIMHHYNQYIFKNDSNRNY